MSTTVGTVARGTKCQSEPSEKKPLKPCCACPETKVVRDKCMVENGQDKCSNEIEAHKECMRKLGFNI